MTNQMTSQQIEIGKLGQHPANVRAKSVEAYEPENIAHLKASIATLGLIQPLVVQKIGSTYGVLGGGRRRAALQELAADKSQKGFAKLVSALEDRQSADGINQDEADEIYDEIDTLSEEADALQTGYLPDDAENAGVFATWNHNHVHLTVGLIRPADQAAGETTSGDAADGALDGPAKSDAITYSAALSSDLQTERAMALGAALASQPETATDLALFKMVSDVLCTDIRTHAVDLSVSAQHRTHAKMDEIDPTAQEQMEEILSTALGITTPRGRGPSHQQYSTIQTTSETHMALL